MKIQLRSSLLQEHFNTFTLMVIEEDVFIFSSELIDTITKFVSPTINLLIERKSIEPKIDIV